MFKGISLVIALRVLGKHSHLWKSVENDYLILRTLCCALSLSEVKQFIYTANNHLKMAAEQCSTQCCYNTQ